MMQIITKAQAREAGEKFYFTGIPCRRGHTVVRFVSDGSCTECKAAQSHEWYSDKPRAAAKRTRWRRENPEREKANRDAWVSANPDRVAKSQKDYAERHPGRPAAACRSWYHRNKERQQERALEYRNANIEQARAASRTYNKANPEKIAAIARTRRARAKSSGGVHTAEDVADIMKMQGGKCAYCRTRLGKKYHVDHVMPLALGGSNDRSNLQILCQPCNQSKSAKHPIVFAQSRGFLL